MAVIRFEPELIHVRQGNVVQYEGEPIVTGADPTYRSEMWFDVDEILKVINSSTESIEAYFSMVVRVEGRFVFGVLYDPPDPQNILSYYPTQVSHDAESTGVHEIPFNSFWTRETLGERASLREAIDQGVVGFNVYSGIHYPESEAIDVAIEIEGDWDNQTPSITYPIGGVMRNINEPIELLWVHNSPLLQTEYHIRYREKGTSDWMTVSGSSGSKTYRIPANSLNIGEYEWQVRTISEYGFESSWSSMGVFGVGDLTPDPVIIEPGDVVPVSDLKVVWESENQEEYQIELVSPNGVVWTSGWSNSDTEDSVDGILQNGIPYTIQLRVRAVDNLWSAWVSHSFTVDYTEPAKPEFTFVNDNEKSTITVYIDNPTPTGTDPDVISQNLYRRTGNTDWIKIADSLNANDYFVDYTPASDTVYEYYVNIRGDNETNADSDVFNALVKVKRAILSIANELNKSIRLERVRTRSGGNNYNATTRIFAGRRLPVTEFGESVEGTLDIECLVNQDEFDLLLNLIERNETMLYRDGRGRKKYVTISNISINDEFINRYSVELPLSEVDYNEAIV
ncbi:hypothetical protein J2Z83_003726 [Virgibacillus natechei]|uniref:Fibronectin type-III domain-containing protein n=1 Tax=Virgibacillus natechei TaxID=1216297 RepID=A0ABS4IKT8_9BACI|nr:hypothetical protein [Virgibacillus natechei]MBP1971575.1 hypothetical protein [Virgibacillus natechei]UZD13091.1 hypothetical protein OLD84_00490 [Virgibacillus natechei]